MKVSTLFLAASLLLTASAQEGDPTTDLSSIPTEDPTSTSTFDDPAAPTITLPPASCASAGFGSCYQIVDILTPTLYVILTVDEGVTIADSEPITSGDPIFSQTDNIVTETGVSTAVPVTASIVITYFQSMGTFCEPSSTTTVIASSDDKLPCVQGSSAPFFTSPNQVLRTRVVRKAKEDEGEGKGTETGGGGGQVSTTAPPEPGSTTNGDPVPVTTEPTTAPPPEPAPTTEDTPQPTEGPTEEPTEEPTGTSPTSAEGIPSEIETPTSTEDTSSETENPTGQNETGKPEVKTDFTTIAEVTDGTTKFVTSAVATLTRSAPTPSTSTGDSGVGSNFLVKAQVLFGAAGLAAVFGL